MTFPKKILINYHNQPVQVYVVGDIQYRYFVARLPREGEVHLNLDFEEDGRMKWIELNGNTTHRAEEIGSNISRQMAKDGYSLESLRA